MDCARTRQDGILVLAVKGRIDATNASEFEVECMAILNKGERQLIFDLSEVVYLSSAGLRAFLRVAKDLKEQQGKMAICNLQKLVRQVFELSGFGALIPAAESVEEAVKIVSPSGE